MNTRLNYIGNWAELAQTANWSVAELAKICGVSERTLQRHFLVKMKKNPKAWLVAQSQKHAIGLLQRGLSIKETALESGYKHASNFSRKFKAHWGVSPSGQNAKKRPKTV